MKLRRIDFPSNQPPRLGNDEIHLWTAKLDGEIQTVLSEDERNRAMKFVSPESRRQFCAGRSILRTLLQHYTGTPAADIRLEYSAHGKPAISVSDVTRRLEFNVSHTRGMAAIAFCRYGPVGVDVEQLAPLNEIDSIVDQTFSRGERDCFFDHPIDQRLAAFYRLWTRRESLGKAIGTGICGDVTATRGKWATEDWRQGDSHYVALTAGIRAATDAS